MTNTEHIEVVKMDKAGQRLRKMGGQSQSLKFTGLSLAKDREMGPMARRWS